MNELFDINKIIKNPEKYGFEMVDAKYKGNSIVIDVSVYITSLTNYIYDDTFIDDHGYADYYEEGISIDIVDEKYDLKDHPTLELKR